MAGLYDNIGSVLGGGTAPFEMNPSFTRFAVNPEVFPTADPRLGVGPVQQTAPTQVISPIARVLGGANDKMANYGALLNKPGVAQALAMAGQLGTGMGGRGLLANDVSALATNLAAGKGVGVGTQPQLPGVIPTNPQQPAQAQGTNPADTDRNGVVTPQEAEAYKEKITIETSGGQPLSNGLTRVGSLLQQNPTLGAGSQAGMPVAAPQAPAQLNRNDNLMMLSGLTNPAFALEVAKQEPVNTTAAANMLEAQYKHAMLGPTYAKTMAEANKTNWEMSPDYITFQANLEQAKRSGNLAAERQNLEELAKIADAQVFSHPTFGKISGGQIIRMTGVTNPSAVTALMTTANAIETAKISAGATIGAARIRSAGEVDAASIAATKTILANQIAIINQAKGMAKMLSDEHLVAPMSAKPDLERKIAYWNNQAEMASVNHANTLKLLGQKSAEETAPTTPPPSKLIVPFVATNTLKEAKKVNGKVYPKGTQIMVKDGGAYDANGNLISIIK